MRFMLLLKSDPHTEAGHMPSPELMAAMGKYNEELMRAGVLLTGEGLQASAKGFRVRPDGASAIVVDGPFPEPRELIAGFWILQVKSKAEAIEWAKRCPLEAAAEGAGQIEVRQVMDHVGPGDAAPEQAARPAPAAADGGKKRRYLMLVKTDGQSESGTPPAPEVLRRMGSAIAELIRTGVMEASEGLHPTSKGARVYVAKGKRTVVDGPFAEAKELVCGLAIMRARDRAEAIELAKRGLALRGGYGETEARLLFEAEDFSGEPAAQVPELVRDPAARR